MFQVLLGAFAKISIQTLEQVFEPFHTTTWTKSTKNHAMNALRVKCIIIKDHCSFGNLENNHLICSKTYKFRRHDLFEHFSPNHQILKK